MGKFFGKNLQINFKEVCPKNKTLFTKIFSFAGKMTTFHKSFSAFSEEIQETKTHWDPSIIQLYSFLMDENLLTHLEGAN